MSFKLTQRLVKFTNFFFWDTRKTFKNYEKQKVFNIVFCVKQQKNKNWIQKLRIYIV